MLDRSTTYGTLNTTTLGAPIALAEAPHRIPVNLAVTTTLILVMVVEVYFYPSVVAFFDTCSTIVHRTVLVCMGFVVARTVNFISTHFGTHFGGYAFFVPCIIFEKNAAGYAKMSRLSTAVQPFWARCQSRATLLKLFHIIYSRASLYGPNTTKLGPHNSEVLTKLPFDRREK